MALLRLLKQATHNIVVSVVACLINLSSLFIDLLLLILGIIASAWHPNCIGFVFIHSIMKSKL
jgi:hypothetical protein